MSFSPETEKLVNELIQAEYKNACEKFGDKFYSLHEGYAILRMFTEKPILEVGSKIKFSNPDIDTSKYNIDENGNVLRNETLIKPWQRNMIELLEKNECLEKEIERLKKLLKNYQEQAICNGFCKNCKHIGNKTLCEECGINNYLWELAE